MVGLWLTISVVLNVACGVELLALLPCNNA